jgi:hypothetical protein
MGRASILSEADVGSDARGVRFSQRRRRYETCAAPRGRPTLRTSGRGHTEQLREIGAGRTRERAHDRDGHVRKCPAFEALRVAGVGAGFPGETFLSEPCHNAQPPHVRRQTLDDEGDVLLARRWWRSARREDPPERARAWRFATPRSSFMVMRTGVLPPSCPRARCLTPALAPFGLRPAAALTPPCMR